MYKSFIMPSMISHTKMFQIKQNKNGALTSLTAFMSFRACSSCWVHGVRPYAIALFIHNLNVIERMVVIAIWSIDQRLKSLLNVVVIP